MALDQIDVDKIGEKGDATEMSFLDHLEELRWHIIRSLIAVFSVGIILFLFRGWLFATLFAPSKADFISYRYFCDLSHYLGLGQKMCFSPPEYTALAIGVAEPFIMSIKISFVAGFIVAFPYVFWELWRFISPGLYDKERKATSGVIFICSSLFLLGVIFGYFVIAPFAYSFLLGIKIVGVSNTPRLGSVLSYLLMFTAPAGLIFELPIVVYFLSKVGLVTPAGMRQYRKHSIIGILLLAALITPPDVVTQFLIGIPLYILYEASIFVSARVEKKAKEQELS